MSHHWVWLSHRETDFRCAQTPERDAQTHDILVEQNAWHALKLAHRAYVMVNGAITMEGKASDLLHSPQIREAYLEGGKP